MCMVDVVDMCEVWEESHHVARRRHLCDSCRRVIERGTKYLAVFTVFNGDANNSKACPECEAIIARFAEGHDGARFAPHDIRYMLGECIADYFDETDAIEYRQDLDWINLGCWLYRKNKFNRTITSEITCHS